MAGSPKPRAMAVRTDGIEVVVADTPFLMDQFIKFQLAVYAGNPFFVPPIVAERREFLDAKCNPFFDDATAVFFLARRSGIVAATIAVSVDHRYNRFHGTSDAAVGYFESRNDLSLAVALFSAAQRWAATQGMRRLIGPINFALHYDCGLLVDGFDRIPSMMTTYNPPYYANLFEEAGFVRDRELFTYEFLSTQQLPAQVLRVAERVRQSGVVRVRPLNSTNPDADLDSVRIVFESQLKRGQGFAPPTKRELEAILHRLRPMLLFRPELSLVAEAEGEPVGFMITLPDANLALKRARGRLFPLGLLRLVWAARNIDRLRVLFFATRAGWQRRGVDALLVEETHRRAVRYGYASAELGWVFDNDVTMNRRILATGAHRIKTHRLYERRIQ